MEYPLQVFEGIGEEYPSDGIKGIGEVLRVLRVERSGNSAGRFWERTGNVPGTVREPCGKVLGTSRERSGNGLGTVLASLKMAYANAALSECHVILVSYSNFYRKQPKARLTYQNDVALRQSRGEAHLQV